MIRTVVVDDEKRIARGIATLVEHLDPRFQVVKWFYDGQAAKSWFEEYPMEADLLITDITMPQISGLELAEFGKTRNRKLKCIILTGYEKFEFAKKAISIGVTEYLLKPVDSHELAKALDGIAVEIESAGAFREGEQVSMDVRHIKEFIQETYKNYSNALLAERMKMNGDYLARIFRTETGRTIGEYLLEVRMEKARELLARPGIKVYEVCAMVGYEDRAFFSRQFKKIYGVNPKEYQKIGGNRVMNSDRSG